MSDSESYSEENLDDFMVKAASVLSEENHPDKETIIESLKQHLASIFNDKSEMENIFKTINSLIFPKKKKNDPQKISNKQIFKLYPLIFAFNPKASFSYIDYYLSSLQLCASEENRPDFPYISSIFAEVITSFFSDQKNNPNLIKKSYLLDKNKKNDLYDKLLNFCNNNIKKNKKPDQSFGCLLLTEFLEKCPLAKDEQNLENLYKIISEYLDDRWFESKLDLLNCTISLIFTAEKNFKPYANSCLFKILDYLTDEEWMKRKLAINIVYTLLFYCKEEILPEKDNIIDFLSVLKDDPVNEVKEVCLQTLNFIKECAPEESDEEFMINNDNDNDKNNDNNYDNNINDNNDSNDNFSKNKNTKNIRLNNNNKTKIKKEKDMLNKVEKEYNEKKGKYNNTKRLNKESQNQNQNRSQNRNQEQNQNENTNEDYENNENNEIENNNQQFNEKINLSFYNIFQELKKIQEEQNELYAMYDEVKQIIEKNYSSLNDRIKVIENKFPNYNIKNVYKKK